MATVLKPQLSWPCLVDGPAIIEVCQPRDASRAPKPTWMDMEMTIRNPHPIITDAHGNASIFFEGSATVLVRDLADGRLMWIEDVTMPTRVGVG